MASCGGNKASRRRVKDSDRELQIARGSRLEARGSRLEARGKMLEARGSLLEARGSIIEAGGRLDHLAKDEGRSAKAECIRSNG